MSSHPGLCRAGMRASGRSGRVLRAFCRASLCGGCRCSTGTLPGRGSNGSRPCRRLLAEVRRLLGLRSGGWLVRNLRCRRPPLCSRIRLPGYGCFAFLFCWSCSPFVSLTCHRSWHSVWVSFFGFRRIISAGALLRSAACFALQAAFFGCALTGLASPCFLTGLLASPLCGAALTFFAAAKKVSKESGLQPPACRCPSLSGTGNGPRRDHLSHRPRS
jgi:hypothetical protein